MYMLDDMIDMGLRDDQKWPSKAHRDVACNLALCNPIVTNRDTLTDIVQKVIAIPKADIKKVTMADLPKHGLTLLCGGVSPK
jgi:hypothetical protein